MFRFLYFVLCFLLFAITFTHGQTPDEVIIFGPTSSNVGYTEDYSVVFMSNGDPMLPPAGGTVSWTSNGGNVTTLSNTACKVQWTSSGTRQVNYTYTVGSTIYSVQRRVTVSAGLFAPVISVSSVTTNSVNVTWNIVSGATHYLLDVSASAMFNTVFSGYKDHEITGTSFSLSGLSPGTTYYFRMRASDGSLVSPYSAISEVIVLPEAPVALSASSISGTAFTANWSSVTGAASYLLYVSSSSNFLSHVSGYNGSSLTATTQNITGLAPTTLYYYRVKAVNASGESSYSNIMNNIPVPEALNATSVGIDKFTARWNSIAGVTQYRLDVSSTPFTNPTFVAGFENLLVNGTSVLVSGLTNRTIYYYRVRAVYSGNSSDHSNVIQLRLLSPNYVSTVQIQKPAIAAVEIPTLTADEISRSTAFYDGIGRPIQSVGWQSSPSKRDVVQPVVYDDYGRELIKYLPFVSTDQTGGYIHQPEGASGYAGSLHHTFYASGLTDNVAIDAMPFAVTRAEASPLGRPLAIGAPGTVWQPDNASTFESWLASDNSVLKDYKFNEANEVLLWTYTPMGAFGQVNAGESALTWYEPQQLVKNRTRDEHHNEVIEYIDKNNRVILKRVQVVAGSVTVNDINFASTYYIYDDFGNLTCVIPPEATRLITKSPSDYFGKSDADKDSFLKRWAFRYAYDSRKRMTQKQVPGAEPVYMVYDNRDRLVLTQDGNQRAATPKKWTFTKYDQLNRPIATGIKDTTVLLTQAEMQAVVDHYYTTSLAQFGETFVGYSVAGNLHGYSNNAYPTIHTGSVPDAQAFLTVTYYDNYDYRAGWLGVNLQNYTYVDENLSQVAHGVTYTQEDAPNMHVTGQMTGTKVKAIGEYTWLKTASYYDDKYRVIQTISDNYKGGTDIISNVYDFTGRVLKTKSTHSEYDVGWKDAVGAAITGNRLVRTMSTTGWNESGAVSAKQLAANTDGWLEVVVSELNTLRMAGLASSNPDLGFANFQFGVYMNSSQLRLYENGSAVLLVSGANAVGDVLRIERTGTTVKFYRNGVLLRTSPQTSTSMLMVDASLYTVSSSIVARSSFTGSQHSIVRTFEYDHAGRLLKTFHKLDDHDEVLLSQNEYNELGQLVDKDLHSVNGSQPKQSVDYRYNIRGWLTSINNASLVNDDSNDDTNDLFGMNLGYNNPLLPGGTAQYNGNISSMTWSRNLGLSEVKENGYNYAYDPMNRITAAGFKEKTSSWATPTAGAFSESGYTYDLNGNIKSLVRYDHRGSTMVMDNLTYDYGTGTTQSNKLLKVTDAGDDGAGFKELNTPGDDYAYDANGNMVWDKNKGGKEILTNGDFDDGSNSWTVADTENRLTFSNGSVNIVSGTTISRITQEGKSRPNFQYVLIMDIERTSGSALTVRVGNISTGVNTTGTSVFAIRPTSSSNFYIDIPANFVGKINRVQLKGLAVISYNYLNLPDYVSMAFDKRLVYAYDATGRKLNQTRQDISGQPVTEKTSDYAGEYFYENDTLKFIHTEEGRIVMTGGAPEYQYHLKDHLGNVRLTFTSKEEVDSDTATYETDHLDEEQSKFLRTENARRVNSALFDHTNGSSDGFAQRLSGRENEKFGLARSLSVMPGDTIDVEVFAKYVDPNGTNTLPLTNFINALVAGTLPSGTVVDGGNYGTSTSSFPFGHLSQLEQPEEDVPIAGITWLIFDRNHEFKDGGYVTVTSAAAENGENVEHERLHHEGILIKEPGYVYIYLGNENETPVEVFFDDFKVVHKKSPVVQVDDYYPFGLSFNSHARENSTPNLYQFNGKELQDELSLFLYDFEWRQYDPAIGRTTTQDLLAEKYYQFSPYSWVSNNPLLYIDPNGQEIWIYYKDDQGKDQKMKYTAGMKYKGKNEFVAQSVNGLNKMNSTKAGSAVLGELVNSKNAFDFKNSYAKDDKGKDLKGVFAFEGRETGGGTIHAGAFGEKELSDGTKLEGVSHELFHGYQHENGQGGASINNEVEAGLFGYSVALMYAMENGQMFGSGTAAGRENQAGDAYSKAFNSLLGKFNVEEFKNAVTNFKAGSVKNASGLYKNFPLKRENQKRSLISKFSPLLN